ncbi:crossover junction endonuclease MUS81-like [Prorops nasuta]|uniref:crossover junction endonuclease MUS81-like n=1 Tax=Prorops nasuta TaxID=863751 RepID=UPI0034CF6715
MKRIMMKKTKPNPLFEFWLQQWKKKAVVENSSMQFYFSKALSSMKKYPLPLESGKDCIILENFGQKLCSMLDKKLLEYKKWRKIRRNKIERVKYIHKKYTESTETDNLIGYALVLLHLCKEMHSPKFLGFNSESKLILGINQSYNKFLRKLKIDINVLQLSIEMLICIDLIHDIDSVNRYTLTEHGLDITKKVCNFKSAFSAIDIFEILSKEDKITDLIMSEFTSVELKQYMLRKLQPLNVETLSSDICVTSPKESDKYLSGSSQISNKQIVPEQDVEVEDFVYDKCYSQIAKETNHTESRTVQKASEEIIILSDDAIEFFENDCIEPAVVSQILSDTEEILDDFRDEYESQQQLVSNIIDRFQKYSKNEVLGKSDKEKKSPNTINRSKENLESLSEKHSNEFETGITLQPNTFDIILLVDTQETAGGKTKPQHDITLSELKKLDVFFEVRRLSVGDFLWIAKSKISRDEIVLPHIIERKRVDDLASSIKDGRFHEQKFRLKQTGFTYLHYMIENHDKSQYFGGIPYSSLTQACTNSLVQDGFLINYTNNHKHSMEYLASMTNILINKYLGKTIKQCQVSTIPKVDIQCSILYAPSFSEFSKSTSKTKNFTVRQMFIRQLIQLKGLTVDKASAITSVYPTPYALILALREAGNNGEKLLSNLQYGPQKRQIGPALSKILYQLYTQKELL